MNITPHDEHLALLWDCSPTTRREALLHRIGGIPARFLDALADARFLKLPQATREALAPLLDTSTGAKN